MAKRGPWQQLSTRTVHETAWLRLIDDDVVSPGGKPGKFTYTVHPPWVLMVPRNEKGEVLLIRQYRYPIDRLAWEFPAGGIEAGESDEAAGNRELTEETGYSAAHWERLGTLVENSSTSSDQGVALLAQDLTRVPQTAQHDEAIVAQQWFSIDQLNELVRRGELPDTKTLAAVYMLLTRVDGPN